MEMDRTPARTWDDAATKKPNRSATGYLLIRENQSNPAGNLPSCVIVFRNFQEPSLSGLAELLSGSVPGKRCR